MKEFEVTVKKESPSTYFGLMLAQKTGSSQIIVRDVAPKGAFANTKIVPGLQLLQINGETADSVQAAVQTLKSAPIGKVTLVVQGLVATAHKQDKDAKIGLSLQKLTRSDGISGPAELIIASVSETGIFAKSGLLKGYRISTINGKACPSLLSEATTMIRDATGDVTVVAVQSEIKPCKKASLGAYLLKHHVSMGDSTFASEKTVNGEEAEFTIEPNSEEVIERELNSMPIVHDGVVVEEQQGAVFDSEYGEPEYTIEPNSAEASERMLYTPFSTEEEVEDGVVDSEYGQVQHHHHHHINEVTTTLSKRFPGEKVGIALKNVKEPRSVIVNRLVKDGLAIRSRCPLSLGQTILYINDQKCPPSAKHATALVSEAPRTITIIARNTKVTAFKKTAKTKLGIKLRSSKKSPRVTVEYVDPHGLFGRSILSKGQTVAAINGEICPDNALDAIEMLRSTVGTVSIEVGYKGLLLKPPRQGMDNFPPIVAATIEEPELVIEEEGEEERGVQQEQQVPEPEILGTRSIVSNKQAGKWIGVSFAKTDGMITVCKIQDESPLQNSELQVGHAIVAVNHEACPESITELISKIQRSSGELVITSSPVEGASEVLAAVARQPKISSPGSTIPNKLLPGQVVAKITKSTKEDKIGIKVVRSLQDRIAISSITEGSLLSTTDLAPGQFIVSINGIPCPPTKDETVKLIRDSIGSLEIVASSSMGLAIKPTVATKVGITIGRTISNEMIIIDVKKGSILESDAVWALRQDQRVVSINGVDCPDNTQDAIALIRNCVGDLTVVAVDRFKQQTLGNSENQSSSATVPIIEKSPQNGARSMPARREEAPGFSIPVNIAKSPQNGSATPEFKEIQAVAYDKQESDMLGLSIGVTQDYAFVNHISADSPFVNTDLCVGHRITKIDGEDCPLPLSDAVDLFAQHVGTMTIDAKEKIVSPGQVSASIVKRSQETNSGVGFGESAQGRVVISKIDPKGLFADSALRVGQVVESINGRGCFDAVAAYETLVSASGKVTIIASATVASALKQNIDQSTGILLGQSVDGRDIIVRGVDESGIFANSGLKTGQCVVSIAGVSCPRSLAEAEGLIQDRVGKLTIVALDTVGNSLENANGYTPETNPIITVSVYKKNQNSKVGMKMRKGIQDGKVVVSGVSEDGPMGGKGLEVGMYIISIDGIPCPLDPKTATGIIKEATGHFAIVASPTVASISKRSKDEKLGVTLARTPTDDIVVHSIANNSAFKHTDLQVGQKVVSINRKKCSGLLDEAIKTLADSVGSVTIIALDTIKL
ncbi:unnamed protein product [Cylindrotheca closterium]|uniref:PDZ domain-containing protein n=1 Tax=Cylindrotheca closterium TaxID=2856 RepID=A0AAD2CII5_9STRA|nr:unnamed protein product [Cylindrotheca closterium]